MASAAIKTGVASGAAARQRHVFVVCTGEQCSEAGSRDLLSDLKHECRHADADVRVGASRCLGHCQLAPAMIEDGRMLGWVSRRRLRGELSRLGLRSLGQRRDFDRH
ncbi:MAG: NAD(P)H-dependent oxidoreductase subunit E [Bryobacteraceae bacterium]|nr:NAD(P)H-dependent oxidoreductase subunit E [Bryobacteraceae bacterium]